MPRFCMHNVRSGLRSSIAPAYNVIDTLFPSMWLATCNIVASRLLFRAIVRQQIWLVGGKLRYK